ncbi:helix-turn-helix transcriptional regulator [[Acholeplasma] multilocale]|uniref:helix-turn-helix transcriptional regulator n=1 Tax=[Acholeplasma] multilocale TaxID=264638 RepID=UPI00047C12B8|nr:helix-turn-helix transcriptional regulator [[Acholeplasma] multilocale]
MTTIQLIKELNSGTKINILCWILKEKRVTVSYLAQETVYSRINISKQICELFEVGILCRDTIGKNNYYFMNPDLDELLLKTIKDVVNAYHIIDLGERENYVPY